MRWVDMGGFETLRVSGRVSLVPLFGSVGVGVQVGEVGEGTIYVVDILNRKGVVVGRTVHVKEQEGAK